MSYAPHPEIWAAYAVVGTLMSLTPGPAVMFVVGQGVWRGPGAALKANLGINTVNTGNFILSGLGLTALLSVSHTAFSILKWVGAAYLVWLGIKAIRGSFRPHDEVLAAKPGRPYLDALIVQASNPKAFLFIGAVLPQFILKTEPIAPQLAALWVISLITEFTVLGGYGLLAGYIRKRADLPAFRAWLERAGGGILICIGLATALYRRAA